MAYSQCSIMAEGDLSVCSQPSAVPGPEWMFKGGVLEEIEIMKGSLKSPQKRRCRSNKSHREMRDQKKMREGVPSMNIYGAPTGWMQVRATVSQGQNYLWTIKQM